MGGFRKKGRSFGSSVQMVTHQRSEMQMEDSGEGERERDRQIDRSKDG